MRPFKDSTVIESPGKNSNGVKIFITGGAGYVGTMLCEQFSKLPQVTAILALDKEPQPQRLLGNSKVTWLRANTSDGSWQDRARTFAPEVVVHTAWQIRPIYGDYEREWRWNVEGSKEVAKFALSTPSVKKFIHFSTAAVYGAFALNTLEHFFREEELLREDEYPYGIQKKKAEENIHELLRRFGGAETSVSILRPAAITGPRGRGLTHRFGLQASLSGNLKGSIFYPIIRAWVFRIPATALWVRQFVHEDDVVDIVSRLVFGETPWRLGVFNLAPPGGVVRPKDMAEVVGKKILWIYPWMVRVAFFFVRHLTFGVVPTARGSWKFYSYPVLMDGSKVTKQLGHQYSMDSKSAFSKNTGRCV